MLGVFRIMAFPVKVTGVLLKTLHNPNMDLCITFGIATGFLRIKHHYIGCTKDSKKNPKKTVRIKHHRYRVELQINA